MRLPFLMRPLCALFVACLPAVAQAVEGASDIPPQLRRTVARLDREVAKVEALAGIDVLLVGDPRDLAARPTARLGPVQPRLALKALPTVRAALSGYGTSLADAGLLTTLRLGGKLRAHGTPFLGMANPRAQRFDLAVRRRTPPERLSATLHHELAHLVAAQEAVHMKAYARLGGGYVGAQPNTRWDTLADAQAAGFVSMYASKNPSEDFAELAELAFSAPEAALQLAADHPVIAAKLVFLTEAYRTVLPDVARPWEAARASDKALRKATRQAWRRAARAEAEADERAE
jgi:hypothetical protein